LSWQIGSLELLNGTSNQWLRTKARPGPLMNCFPVEILSPVRPSKGTPPPHTEPLRPLRSRVATRGHWGCSVCVFVYIRIGLCSITDTRIIHYYKSSFILNRSRRLTRGYCYCYVLPLAALGMHYIISTARWRIVSHYTTSLSSFEIKTISPDINLTY